METMMVRPLQQQQHLPGSSSKSFSFGENDDEDSYYNDNDHHHHSRHKHHRSFRNSTSHGHGHDIKHAAASSSFVGRNSIESSSSEASLSEEESSFSSVPFVPTGSSRSSSSRRHVASSSSSSNHGSTSSDDDVSNNSSSCTTTQSTTSQTDHHPYNPTSTSTLTDNPMTTINQQRPNLLRQQHSSSRRTNHRTSGDGGSLSLRSVFGTTCKSSSGRRNRGSTGRLYTSERRLKSRRAINGMRNSTSVASLEFDSSHGNDDDDDDDLMSEVMMKVQTAKAAAGGSSSPFIADDDDRSGTLSFGYHQDHDNDHYATTHNNNHVDSDSDSDSHLFQYHDTAPSPPPPPSGDLKNSFISSRIPTTPSNIIGEQVSPLPASRRMFSMTSTSTTASTMSYSPRPSPVRFMDSTTRNSRRANDIINTNTNTSRSLSNMITQMEQEQLQQWGGHHTDEHERKDILNRSDDELFPEFELSSSNVRPGLPFTPTTTTRMEKRKSLSESCIISPSKQKPTAEAMINNAVKHNNNADHDEEEPVAATAPTSTTAVLTIREVHRNTTILKISSARHVTANTMHDNDEEEDDLLVDWPSSLPTTTKVTTPQRKVVRRSDRWSEIQLSTSTIPRHLLTKSSSSDGEGNENHSHSKEDDASATSTRSLFAGFLLWGGANKQDTNENENDTHEYNNKRLDGGGHSSGYGTGNTAEEEAIRERAMTILRRCSSSMHVEEDGEEGSPRPLSYFDGEGSGSSRQMMVVFNESTKHHLSPTRNSYRINRSSSGQLVNSPSRRSMTGPSLPPSGTSIHHTTNTNTSTTQQTSSWTFIFFPLSLFKFHWTNDHSDSLVVPNRHSPSHEDTNSRYSIVKRTSASSTSQDDNNAKKKPTASVNSLATTGMATANQCALAIGSQVDDYFTKVMSKKKTSRRRGWKQRASMEASLLVESYRDFALFCASVVAPNYVERPEI